jgi:hypothetical protein
LNLRSRIVGLLSLSSILSMVAEELHAKIALEHEEDCFEEGPI